MSVNKSIQLDSSPYGGATSQKPPPNLMHIGLMAPWLFYGTSLHTILGISRIYFCDNLGPSDQKGQALQVHFCLDSTMNDVPAPHSNYLLPAFKFMPITDNQINKVIDA